MSKRLFFAAISVLCLAATPALAQTAPETDAARAIPVGYADLDLNQPADAAALLSRLRYAASAACERSEIAQPGPSTRRAIESCRAQALESAVTQLDQPELTRLYLAQR